MGCRMWLRRVGMLLCWDCLSGIKGVCQWLGRNTIPPHAKPNNAFYRFTVLGTHSRHDGGLLANQIA